MSEKEKPKVREGIPMTEEEIKEQEKVWKDIEESIKKVYKEN